MRLNLAKALVFIYFPLSLQAQTALPKELGVGTCMQFWGRLMEMTRQREPWRRIRSDGVGPAFQIPRKKIGHWLQILKLNEGTYQLKEISPEQTLISTVDAKCQVRQQRKIAHKREKNTHANAFTDESLSRILATNTLIYIWSPAFVNSWPALKSAERVAKLNGLNFLPLLSDKAGERWLASARLSHKIPKHHQTLNQSVELEMRADLSHAPTMFVISQGRVQEPYFTGVYSAPILHRELRRILK
jgi:hypothetical protein